MTSLSSFPRVHRQTDDENVRKCHVDVLCVGPWHDREFALVRSSIDEAQQWKTTTGLDQAMDDLTATSVAPELVLLAQPLPGGYRQAQIDRLQRLAPLARIVVVAGSWCEGELRNLKPVASVLRLYWYELPAWWRAAKIQIDQGLCPSWSQPLDGSLVGRWTSRSDLATTSAGGVAVATDDYALYETWAAALRAAGRSAFWQRIGVGTDLPREVTAGIWDGGQLSGRELTRLEAFCDQIRGADGRVVALSDFPRREHFQWTQAFGLHALFGKPYVVEEVLAALLA